MTRQPTFVIDQLSQRSHFRSTLTEDERASLLYIYMDPPSPYVKLKRMIDNFKLKNSKELEL